MSSNNDSIISTSTTSDIRHVEILKRLKINKNTTHDCIVDMNIKLATLWRLDRRKHMCALILYTLTLGVLYVISLIWKNVFIFMSCVPCGIEDAEYVVITDGNGIKYVEMLIKEDFTVSSDLDGDDDDEDESEDKKEEKNKKQTQEVMELIKKSPYYERKEKISLEEAERRYNLKMKIQKVKELPYQKVFIHFANKYRYDHNEGLFVPATMYLNRYTKRELIELKGGIPNKHFYDYLYYTYPKNEIKLKSQGLIRILIDECCNWLYFYNLCSIVIWCIDWWYWQFAVIIAGLTVFLIITGAMRKMDNLKKIINADHNSKIVKVRRPFNRGNKEAEFEEVEAKTIVPGDSILLEKSSNDEPIIVPCDGVILEGYCTVNESDITGENTLVLRKELKNENELFNYQKDRDSILFQGTSISTLYSSKAKKEQIIMLATNTGYNTYRGNMVKNWEHQKPDNYRFNYDFLILSIVFILMWITSCILVFLFLKGGYDTETQTEEPITLGVQLLTCLDSITVVFPPSLSICVSFGRLFFNYILKEKGISCVIEKKIDSAGRIDIVVLDKTGTLTESHLGIHCYKTTMLNENSQLVLGKEEFFPSTLNKIYKRIWQHIYAEKLKCQIQNKPIDYSYQVKSKFNIIYFTECLATCHNIYRINNQNFGNSLDQKLFNEINWDIIQESDDINSLMYVQPHNAYKITENTIFGGTNTSKANEVNFCLHYLERFEFMSQFQSMTVVVKNSIDNSIRVYTKGAPEKIKKICNSDTLPIDLDQQLRKYTGDGFRVLACATRQIEKYNKNTMNAEQLQYNMIFLGLIVFKNQIKKDTKIHIEHLQESKCKLVIATGDNVFTTVSVALQCGILQFDNDIYHIETSENNETSLVITHSYYKQVDGSEDDENPKGVNPIQKDNIEECNDIIQEDDNPFIFKEVISNILANPHTIICCSGPALNVILKKKEDNKLKLKKLLDSLILIKGKIFYRMLPDHKSSLVAFFQQDSHTIVAMCGDGANDCSAFMTSDVGVAIKQTTGNNLISHFYSKNESIGCLEDIITNGRACLENKIIIIKYMILYSFIQISTVMFLNIENQEMNNTQYIGMDVFCVLIPMLIAARTMAKVRLSNTRPSESMFDLQFTMSVIGEIFIQIGNGIGFGIYIKNNTLHSEKDVIPRDDLNILTSYLYVFSLFQYLNVLFIFNSTSCHRKPFYSNRLYLFYYALLFIICTMLITIKEMPTMMFGLKLILFEDDTQNFELRLERNKAISIGWVFGLFLLSFVFETILFLLCRKIKLNQKPVTVKEREKEDEGSLINNENPNNEIIE